MTVTPIQARCRRCGGDFHLFEVIEARSGLCPRCGWRLTEDWTAALLDHAARADIAQRHLVGALRRLRNLPGSMVLLPSSVLRNVVIEVGWDSDLAEHAAVLVDGRERLEYLTANWPKRQVDDATRRSRRSHVARWPGLTNGDSQKGVLIEEDASGGEDDDNRRGADLAGHRRPAAIRAHGEARP